VAIDKNQFEVHLFAPESFFEILLRGHLWIENLINDVIDVHMTDPSALDLDRISFRQKIDIAQGFGFINPEDGRSLRVLNRLRNKLAHNVMAEPSQNEIRDLVNMLAGRPKAIFDNVMHVPQVIEQADSKFFSLRYWFFSYATHLDYLCASEKYTKDNRTKLFQVAAVQVASEKYAGKRITDEEARRQFDLADPPDPSDIWIQ
jgi:hypothetical protein